MPHQIPEDEIYRLSTLRGVTDLDEWQRQLENSEERIRVQLHSSVDDAWRACLPTWIEVGRVKDLSRSVRVPKYWPSYANQLGRAFAEIYCDDYQFVIDMVGTLPPDSYEYLCAYDLLELIVSEFYGCELPVPKQLFAIDLPAPSVVRVETEDDHRYSELVSIGEFLHLSCLIEYGDDDA